VRIANDNLDQYLIAHVSATDHIAQVELYAGGKRRLLEIGPDGGAPFYNKNSHAWIPIPIRKSGDHILYSHTFSSGYISGIAFGNNLWNHAKNAALAYAKAMNGGNPVYYYGEWNYD
jgi:hypothetical protein